LTQNQTGEVEMKLSVLTKKFGELNKKFKDSNNKIKALKVSEIKLKEELSGFKEENAKLKTYNTKMRDDNIKLKKKFAQNKGKNSPAEETPKPRRRSSVSKKTPIARPSSGNKPKSKKLQDRD
jgi:chromosome segregation ATPase